MQNVWCGEIVVKGYTRLLAHITAQYATSELLYNEESHENIIFIISENSDFKRDI
jgi:hypothetical protein